MFKIYISLLNSFLLCLLTVYKKKWLQIMRTYKFTKLFSSKKTELSVYYFQKSYIS